MENKKVVGVAIANSKDGRMHAENVDARSRITKTKDVTRRNSDRRIVKKACIREN